MSDPCKATLDRLGRFLDGEIDGSAAREIEEHLAACPRCAAARDELLEADRMLREGISIEEAASGADPAREEAAVERVLERLRAEPEPAWARRADARRARGGRLRFRLGLRWAGGLVAATAAVILVLRLSPSRVTAPALPPVATRAQDPAREPVQEKTEPEARQAPAAPKASRPETPPALKKRMESKTEAIPMGSTEDAFVSPREWLVIPGDTLRETPDLAPRLDSAERALLAQAPAGARADRARHWRRIGDLWESIGRRDGDPAAFRRALLAYGRAAAEDPEAADLDSLRVRRARQGAAGGGEEPGNTAAPRR